MENQEKICVECGAVIEGEDFIELANGEFVCECCRDEYIYCEECGEYEKRENSYYIHSEDFWVCEHCYYDKYGSCECCGERYNLEELTYIDNEFYCIDCRDNEFEWCDICDNYVARGETTEINGENVCDKCRNYYYRYCEECDEWIHEDDYDFEEECCFDCVEKCRLVSSYHESDKSFSLYDNGENPKYHIGFELETGNKETRNYEKEVAKYLKDNLPVQLERDSSISACSDIEIISQPMSIEYIYGIKDELKSAFEFMISKNYKSHDLRTCGLHLHFSRIQSKENSDEVVSRGWLILETFKEQIMKISGREGDTYYYRWLSEATHNTGISIKAIEKLKNNDSKNLTRYLAINNQKDTTIEFRFNRGTLNFDTFMARIEFTKNLYDIMINIEQDIEKTTWADLIKGEYIQKYAKTLNLENVDIKVKDYSLDILTEENRLKDKINKAIKYLTKISEQRIKDINGINLIVKNDLKITHRNLLDKTEYATKYCVLINSLNRELNCSEISEKNIQDLLIRYTAYDEEEIKNKIYKIMQY